MKNHLGSNLKKESFLNSVENPFSSDKTMNWTNIESKKNDSFMTQTPIPCKSVHPHDYPGFDWIPAYITIASASGYSFMTVYMAFIVVGSTFLNGLVLVATYKFKVLRQPINYIITNLTVADFCSGLGPCLIITIATAEGYFYLGETACQFEGWFAGFFSLAQINSISVMAFERFLVICKPFGPSVIGKKLAIAGVIFSWLYSLLVSSFLLTVPKGVDVEGFGTHCSPNWVLSTKKGNQVMIFFFIFGFFVPLSIIVFCYSKVMITLRQISKESSLSGSKNPESKVAKMVILMTGAFLFSWLPYAALSMDVVINQRTEVSGIIHASPSFFAKASLIYNPLIYIGMNKQGKNQSLIVAFRDCVIRMICGGRNPWADEVVASSQATSQITTVSTNKVAPA